ncbi:MAG: 3,4-dehydroadipyl-CoA semialdehyde dehydrogenase, partial [Vicinamibacterales bacterium]
MKLQNYAAGRWMEGEGSGTPLLHAVNGDVVAHATSEGIEFQRMVDHARRVGGPALRRMTFHQRARMLKAMALHLSERKDDFYALSAATGATKADSWIDIDGGIGTFFVYASKGRREFPDETFYIDGPLEPISKGGTFVGRHICVPLEGVAVFINAFNFPVWGMMEKLAPALLAGVPAIVKPATLTCYLTERVFRVMIESGIFPEGSIQLICGSAGDLLDHLGEQDSVAFTGSAATGRKLKTHPAIIANSVRFNLEADSLNCAILGPDARPGTDEFDLFVKEVVREMTAKAGQKCTAIRRTIVPDSMMQDVVNALKGRLAGVKIGDPAVEGVKMGPLAGSPQVREVGASLTALKGGADVV